MSVDSQIKVAVIPLVPVCCYGLYRGTEPEYCTFNYTELPDDFADDTPGAIRYLIQLHWFFSRGYNPLSKKKQIKQALESAGFTYPSVTDATDADGGHFVFECEYADGDV